MTWSLFRKELRSMLPFMSLIALLALLGVAEEMLTHIPHLRPIAVLMEEFVESAKVQAIFTLVLTLALASGLLVREFDDGTIEFLDSLPVTRGQVFFAKLLAAAATLLLGGVLDIAAVVLFQTLSWNSLDRSFHWPFLLTTSWLAYCQSLVFLSLGLALSYLRRFGWLVVGLLFWAYWLAAELWPAVGVLNLFALTEPHLEGQRWVLPRTQLVVQLSLAAVLLTVAYGLFTGTGDRLVRAWQRLAQSRRGQVLLFIGSGLIVIVGLSLGFVLFEGQAEQSGDAVTVSYADWEVARARTRHYEFVYPSNLAGRAKIVLDHADETHEKVRTLLGVEPAPRPIVVDMTSQLARHAGVAFWEKLRLDLTESEHPGTLLAILGHETTHVLIERLADNRLRDKFAYARFFHEGVATYVEYRLFEPEQGLDVFRSVAAVMRWRKEVDFAELVDDERLRSRRDTNLVYSLGEVFVAALVQRYGEASIKNVCQALARKNAPRELTGLDLWNDTFQACGYNLDEVVDGFYAILDEEVERHRELVETLPRLRGAVGRAGMLVTVETLWEPLAGWTPVCRFRPERDSSDQQYFLGSLVEPGKFQIPRGAFPGATAWLQLGLHDLHGRVIYEPWVEVTLDQ